MFPLPLGISCARSACTPPAGLRPGPPQAERPQDGPPPATAPPGGRRHTEPRPLHPSHPLSGASVWTVARRGCWCVWVGGGAGVCWCLSSCIVQITFYGMLWVGACRPKCGHGRRFLQCGVLLYAGFVPGSQWLANGPSQAPNDRVGPPWQAGVRHLRRPFLHRQR